jgi:beta-fructofuranosidase
MAFLDTGADGRFVGQIGDPVPLRMEQGRYLLDDSLNEK